MPSTSASASKPLPSVARASAALLLCGGSGSRMRGTVEDKILAPLAGKPVVCHSFEAFRDSGVVETLVLVCRDDAQQEALQEALLKSGQGSLRLLFARGGKERQDSVFNGLEALPSGVDYVFIHDAARPLISRSVLERLSCAVSEDGAAVLAHRVTDTIKKVQATKKTLRKRNLKDVPRSALWAMETPQVFRKDWIHDSYCRLRAENESVTDDTAAAQRAGHKVTLVENPDANPKLTLPDDFAWVEFLISRKAAKAS